MKQKSAGLPASFVASRVQQRHSRKAMLNAASLLALSTAVWAADPRMAVAQTTVVETVTSYGGGSGPATVLNGNGNGGFMVLTGGQLTLTNSVVQNYSAVGGDGSGGGAGLGGAVFVGNGGTLLVNSSSFGGNTAIGGTGGRGLQGGGLNAGSGDVVPAPFIQGLPGLPGVTYVLSSFNPILFGDGHGNGLNGRNGYQPLPALLGGQGGMGGIGGAGQIGWSVAPPLIGAVQDATTDLSIATQGVVDATQGVNLATQNVALTAATVVATALGDPIAANGVSMAAQNAVMAATTLSVAISQLSIDTITLGITVGTLAAAIAVSASLIDTAAGLVEVTMATTDIAALSVAVANDSLMVTAATQGVALATQGVLTAGLSLAQQTTNDSLAVQGNTLAASSLALATQQLSTATSSQVFATALLAGATANLTTWVTANSIPFFASVGLGGNGGDGGAGGQAGFGYSGGQGGIGGLGGMAGGGAQGGAGGDGGNGGVSGFGAGGSSGGIGGLPGLGGPLTVGLNIGPMGAGGAGGVAGFGGGVGTRGIGNGDLTPSGGGGGSGLGGAIFIQQGAQVTIAGNTTFFNNNVVLAGGSDNGGASAAVAGSDLFLQGTANVNLTPGYGNTINFYGANAISDDSGLATSGQATQGKGGTVTIYGGGMVVFNQGNGNTYTGTTLIGGGGANPGADYGAGTGTQLWAIDGDGLPSRSLLQLTGSGVFETTGTIFRYVGTQSGQVQWTGSGGFAAVGGDLTLSLNHGQPLIWANGGSFVPDGSTLVLGAPNATGKITLTNDITTLSSANMVSMTVVPNQAQPGTDANSDTAIYTGVISGPGNFSVNDSNNNGVLQLTKANTYTGQTYLKGGLLQLIGAGAIANSVLVIITNPTAVLDISRTTAGTSFAGLAGVGTVNLGAAPLAITAALTSAIWDGTIQGTGALTIAAGQQTFGGQNIYTGTTTINAPATLVLTGSGSIATSAGVIGAGGIFDISGTTVGASITTLSGTGLVQLGGKNLLLSAASGTFAGSITDGGLSNGTGGQFIVNAGSETLTGVNSYTGMTTITAGATLAIAGSGSIATSSGMAANGTLDISASTTGGISLTTLFGSGTVNLGTKTLTLTGQNHVFDGSIVDGQNGGKLVLQSGVLGLTGTNTYTGTTTIAAGTYLFLNGTGSIANSSNVILHGLFDISGTSAGASVVSVDGDGFIDLGAQTLTFSNASGSFSGIISDAGMQGSVVVQGGTETLTGLNTYIGTTTIASGAMLALSGGGSIASSAGVSANGALDITNAGSDVSITTLSGTGRVNLGANTLTLSAAASDFAGVIDGTGGLTLAAGTETLSGVNTYTGVTNVNTGAGLALSGGGSVTSSSTVRVDGNLNIAQTTAGTTIRNLTGAGTVSLGSETLSLTNSSASFGGVIGGTGGITVNSGTQFLYGVNTYTGTTTIAPTGTLALGSGGSIAASSGVVNNGALDISATAPDGDITTLSGNGTVALGANTLTLTNAQGTFSGTIGGTGRFAITGGAETLTGTSTYTGGTSVSNAQLTVNGNAAMGDAAGSLALSNATLTTTTSFDTARAISLTGTGGAINTNGNTIGASGVISGSGALVATGGGRLNLTGTNTYSGGTLITGQTTVAINSDAALGDPSGSVEIQSGVLLATAPLTINRTVILDAGGRIVAGGNALNVTGQIVMAALNNQLLFSGTTRVNGDWSVDGNGLVVEAGSSFTGVGTVTDRSSIAGTLAPGDSPGTIVFTAPLTLTDSATYSINIDGTGTGAGAGNYSRVLVQGAGNSFTAAGLLSPVLRGITGSATNTYTPAVGQSFVVAQAEGGVLGSFSSLQQPASGLLNGTRMDALYTSNALTMYVTPTSYTNLRPFNVNLTPNQTSTAGSLDALRGVAGVRNSVNSTEVLGYIMRQTPQLMPAMLNNLASTIYGDTLMSTVRSSQLFGSNVADRINVVRGTAVKTQTTADGRVGINFWTNGFGENSSNAANGNTGFSAKSVGGIYGMDKKVDVDLLVGFAAGYSKGSTSSKATGSSAQSDLGFVSGYGSWTQDNAFIDAQFGVSFGNYKASRWLGAVPLMARGSGSGTGFNGGLMAGLRYEASGVQIQPELGVRTDSASRVGLTETGGSAASLNVNSSTFSSTRSLLGVRLQTNVAMGNGYIFTPNAQLHWAHELGRTSVTTTASFVNAAGTRMSNVSGKNSSDAAQISLGGQISMPASMSAYISVGTEIGRSVARSSVNGGFQWKW